MANFCPRNCWMTLVVVFLVFSKMEAEMQALITQVSPVLRLDWFGLSLKIMTHPFFDEIFDGKVIKFRLSQIEHKVMSSCLHLEWKSPI